jgi:uncharacterized LabA/DUF88 family protein
MVSNMRTYVYVDAFNLYFGALKGTSYKWLNIEKLCQSILDTQNKIVGIKYFTAHVSSTHDDPYKAIHQQLYLRALSKECKNLQIIKGQYTTHIVKKRLVTPINGSKFAEVYHRTEKGSDVNLAVHLVNDAWLNQYDCGVVISGDSDLAESIKLARKTPIKKVIGVLAPGKRGMSKELIREASFIRSISRSALAASQFPTTISNSSITKPSDW